MTANTTYPKTNINLVILENTARNLPDFRQAFAAHTEIMALVKLLPSENK